ncbi:hypothetical protein [Pontiella sulfatireligans]|uniref:CBM-cenC domain-containing protein n=1 Tax=Pontiella sulfatireligans TaxID=2750658 RepID=A0A6C2UQ71_9BACT|nr:hypothetical protein [Pontiella sulfatireligans]VGO22083.1 hypothetical protein SCARR_04164 [Pontiella sulfatireligans]
MRRCIVPMLAVWLAGISFSSYAAVGANWVVDPGFEALASVTEPNTSTAPWGAVESGDWAVQREQTIVHGGTNAVSYMNYGNTYTVYQDLPAGLTVDSSAIYECRFWMRLDEKSNNVVYTNESVVQVMISTTTNGIHGSTYKWKASEYNVIPSVPYEWQEMVVRFSGSDLADVEDEYIRLQVKTSNAKCEYRVFIDDVQFGVYAPNAPDSTVLAAFYGCSGGTNDYAQAGVEAAVSLDKAYLLKATAGSIDETFGSASTGASIEYGAYEVRIGTDPTNDPSQQVGFKIVNQTGGPLQLDSISFDYARYWAASPQDVELLYTWGALGGITNNTVIHSVSGLTHLGSNKGDFDDFDWSLDGLTDRVLSDGETAAFALKASNAGDAWNGGAFDNIAILGAAYEGAGYDAWAVDYNLIGGALDDDDGDGIDNLTEYAQNGVPDDPSKTGTSPALGAMASDGGTQWIEFVYLKRVSADNGLTYSLVQRQGLVQGGWMNNGDIVEAGESVAVGNFKTVTNQVPTNGKSQEFVKLLIESD